MSTTRSTSKSKKQSVSTPVVPEKTSKPLDERHGMDNDVVIKHWMADENRIKDAKEDPKKKKKHKKKRSTSQDGGVAENGNSDNVDKDVVAPIRVDDTTKKKTSTTKKEVYAAAEKADKSGSTTCGHGGSKENGEVIANGAPSKAEVVNSKKTRATSKSASGGESVVVESNPSEKPKPVSEPAPHIQRQSQAEIGEAEYWKRAYHEVKAKCEALEARKIPDVCPSLEECRKTTEMVLEQTIARLKEEKRQLLEKLEREVEKRKALEAKLANSSNSTTKRVEKVAEPCIANTPLPVTGVALLASAEVDALRKELEEARAKAARANQFEAELSSLQSKMTKLEPLEQQLAAAEQKIASMSADNGKRDQNDRYLLTLERMTRLYESFTGITIQSIEEARVERDDGSGEMVTMLIHKVRQKGNRGVLNYLFMTELEANPNSVATYTPLNASHIEGLPTFLKREIELDAPHMQNFFWRVSDWLQRPT
ncbi:hypothetical protein SeMB42_g01403 [Synchytrium endobioticum]|uniref:Monopolin complex subunit Csm1/Pcs1 C-terminal domain-containing protein n=1 Tax=Synchytrium endobioticum TaxID=286115 RepID=A0A507DMR0_9FUNG|nr:hypothetical protein SeMB42_g01403 [Synchytrium endobioticum]